MPLREDVAPQARQLEPRDCLGHSVRVTLTALLGGALLITIGALVSLSWTVSPLLVPPVAVALGWLLWRGAALVCGRRRS